LPHIQYCISCETALHFFLYQFEENPRRFRTKSFRIVQVSDAEHSETFFSFVARLQLYISEFLASYFANNAASLSGIQLGAKK
jgi:hypothetical protein